jgi:hypothetical protein
MILNYIQDKCGKQFPEGTIYVKSIRNTLNINNSYVFKNVSYCEKIGLLIEIKKKGE